jgi:hypothetical protein
MNVFSSKEAIHKETNYGLGESIQALYTQEKLLTRIHKGPVLIHRR